MSRLTRIVCDGPHCSQQIERFSGDWEMMDRGSYYGDVPEGWHVSRYTPPTTEDATKARPHSGELLHFCSLGCMADYGKSGKRKTPFTGGETISPVTAE